MLIKGLFMYTLYKLTNQITGKSYIGITKYTVERRWKGHIHAAFTKKTNYKISNAIRKYGKDVWTKEILLEDVSKDEIEELEILAIDMFDTVRTGYNTSFGGKLPSNFTYKKEKSTNQQIVLFTISTI